MQTILLNEKHGNVTPFTFPICIFQLPLRMHAYTPHTQYDYDRSFDYVHRTVHSMHNAGFRVDINIWTNVLIDLH